MPELVDQFGRELVKGKPSDGQAHAWTPSDRARPEVSYALEPYRVGQILETASQGDPREQAQLAQEILEKDWEIGQAMQTRVASVVGTAWQLQPANDSAQAKRVAKWLTEALQGMRGDSTLGRVDLRDMIGTLARSQVVGYSLLEQVWEGGRVVGWAPVDPAVLSMINSRRPLLVTTSNGAGVDVLKDYPAGKWLWHQWQPSADAARGGLIRPLAWLYIFKNLSFKDMMRFLEKYGMPFIAARLDDAAWSKERSKIANLVRNFGSDGGGVFTKATELELLQAGGGSAETYLKVVAYLESAATKMILGQTSTSNATDSNRSTAAVHELVRQDLRAADCAAIGATVRDQVLVPMARAEFGESALAVLPEWQWDLEPPADQVAMADLVGKLSAAGYKPTAEAVSRMTGVELVETSSESATGDMGTVGARLSAIAGLQKSVSEGISTIEAARAQMVGLMGVTPEQAAAMLGEIKQKTEDRSVTEGPAGGKQPVSREDAKATKGQQDLALADRPAVALEAGLAKGLAVWLGPVAAELDRLAAAGSEGELAELAGELVGRLPELLGQMDTSAVEEVLTQAALQAGVRSQESGDRRGLALADGDLSFPGAAEFLGRRIVLPTGQSTTMLALAPDFPAQAKAMSWFSARVSSVNILQELKAEAESLARGETDLASARARLKTFLQRQGFTPNDPGAGTGDQVTNLASSRRLNLILETTVQQAQAMTQRAVSLHPAVRDRWPYYRYEALDDARPSHKAFDGLVLPKDHPFWLDHTPPWGFGCRCTIVDADQADAEKYGVGQGELTEAPNGATYGTLRTGRGNIVNLPPHRPDYVFRVDGWSPDEVGQRIAALPAGELKDVLAQEWERRQAGDGQRGAMPGARTSGGQA